MSVEQTNGMTFVNQARAYIKNNPMAGGVYWIKHLCNENERLNSANEVLLAELRNIMLDCEADYPPSNGAIKQAAQAAIAKVIGGE